MSLMRLLALFVLLAALALGPLDASADDHDGIAPFMVAQGNGGKSLSEAVEQVRRQTGGQILSADTKVEGNREVHLIKVLHKDGKVKTHRVQGRKRGG